MNTRLDIINNYVKEKGEIEREKARQEIERIRNLEEQVKAFFPRVKDLCQLIKALDEAKLLKETSRDGKQFFTDGWTHKLGLSYLKKIYLEDERFDYSFNSYPSKNSLLGIGKQGGGCCHYSLILFEDGTLWAKGEDVGFALKRFLEEFDKLEETVFQFIDKLNNEIKIEKEKKSLLQYLKTDYKFYNYFCINKGEIKEDFETFISNFVKWIYEIQWQYEKVEKEELEDLKTIGEKTFDISFLYDTFKNCINNENR